MPAGRRWTKKEDAALLDGVGVFSIGWFRKKAGVSFGYPNAPLRSRDAVCQRARRLLGSKSLTRGTYNLTQAARETGYAREQLQRAQTALNQKWKRLSPRGRFLITFDQLDEMIGWLRQDYWCAQLRLYGCVNCGDSHGSSLGMGLCNRCYPRIRRLLRSFRFPTRRDQLLEFVQNLDAPPGEMQRYLIRARHNLERGWSMTDEQIRILAKITTSL